MGKIMKDTIKKAYALLDLERKIVGIKIAHTKEEFDKFQATTAIAPISYCVAVKSATLGHAIKFKKDESGCGGSTRALGLTRPTEDFLNGKSGCSLGLYSDEKISAQVAKSMKRCEEDAYGVIVKPLERFEEEPDVVLIVTNTRNCMRVIQGYTYFYGLQEKFCMTGNQAVCVEATAVPIVTEEMNISMFCSGTRFLAGWKDYEVVIGIPFYKFSRTVEGIRLTVNAVESDERKIVIADGLRQLGYNKEEIILGDTYYLRLEREKRAKREGK
jgi:uncharacterized protein (DUF169 family)